MTQHERRESPLRSLAYLEAFLDSTTIGFAYFDEAGVLLDCNEVIARLLHTTTDFLVGEDFRHPRWAVPRNDETPFSFDDPAAVRAIDSRRPYSDVLVGFNFPDAPRRWLSINTYPVTDQGTPNGMIVSFTDVTREQRTERMLRLFGEVSRALTRASREEEALASLVDALVAVGGYQVAWVSVVDDAGRLDVVHRAGEVAFLDGVALSADPDVAGGRGPTGRAMREGSTQVVHDVVHHDPLAPWHGRAREHGIESIIALALDTGRGRVVVSVADRDIYGFDDESVRALEDLLGEVRVLLERVRALEALQGSLSGTMAAMARITEIRDPYTAGHQLRVGALSGAIATRLGLDESTVRAVVDGASLHDLGKIAVPSEILGRPGRLSTLELEAVQRHCAVGAEILEQAALSPVAVDIARHHHERLDGSGYPDGLRGDEIELPARVVAVADVLEAMTHHRPHRPRHELQTAIDHLVAGAGVTFDADVVAACLAIVADGYVVDD